MDLFNRKMYEANIKRIEGRHCILEIGFGDGRQLEMLKKKRPDCSLYGIDTSEDMLKTAQSRLGSDVELHFADVSCIPFEDGFFDAVITTNTCYLWMNQEKALCEIYRVLKPGGFFVTSYNENNASRAGKRGHEKNIYDPYALLEIAEKIGFTDLGMLLLGKHMNQTIFEK